MIKNKFIGIFVCILMIAMVFPVSGDQILDYNSVQLSLGKTIYVGGSGPGNHTKIQDAINNTSNGDTVFVYDDSSPYYENLVVNKSITLKGENRNTTIIDGKKVDFVINVSAQGVTITGLMIIHSSSGSHGYAGIFAYESDNCHIDENIIKENHYGIHIRYSSHCNITRNIVDNNYYMGIVIRSSPYAHIMKNRVSNTSWFGIDIHSMSDSLVCELNHIEGNDFSGIFLFESNSNIIRNNNFIRNKHHVFFYDSNNIWEGNYWNRPRILPKLIFGRVENGDRFPNLVDFDWHPARVPYDILPLEV